MKRKMFDALRTQWMLTKIALHANKRGAATTSEIIEMGIALLVVGLIVPIGLSSIFTANTTGWTPTTVTVFTVLLPVLAVLALALLFYQKIRS